MTWHALTKKQQQIVAGVGVLVVLQIIALGYFMLKTPGNSATSAREELHELQRKIGEAKDILQRRTLVADNLALSCTQLEELSVFTPTVFDRYAWAYEYISRRASDAGIDIDGLEEMGNQSASAQGENEQPNPYEISISTHCGYNELVKFLWHLEGKNPLIVVKELMVNASTEDPWNHTVRIVVQWPPPFEIETADD